MLVMHKRRCGESATTGRVGAHGSIGSGTADGGRQEILPPANPVAGHRPPHLGRPSRPSAGGLATTIDPISVGLPASQRGITDEAHLVEEAAAALLHGGGLGDPDVVDGRRVAPRRPLVVAVVLVLVVVVVVVIK